MVSFIRFTPQEGHAMLHCFLSVQKLVTLPYCFFRRCRRLLQKLSASSESFFRRSIPHLQKKAFDLRRSCAANASLEKPSEGQRDFFKNIYRTIGHGLTETKWHETAFLFTDWKMSKNWGLFRWSLTFKH